MANPQINELVDYIKKASQAGQSSEQTRQILYKNGWSDAEVEEAFVSISASKPQQRPQPQQGPQPQQQKPVQQQPQVQQQSQPQQTQPQVASQPKSQPSLEPQHQLAESKKFRRGGGRYFVLKLFIIFIILAIFGFAGYFIFVSLSTEKPAATVTENEEKNRETPTPLNLTTAKLTTVLQEYDMSKGTAATLFSKAADKVAYCAPQKTGNKIDCFLNDEKLSNSYNYKPYWIGISPDGNRVVFLYFDTLKKQSFVFENGEEGARYDGTITSPNFSDDSQSFMYAVLGKDSKQFVVLNGEPGPVHERIYGAPSLSKGGRYLLYGARDGQDIFWVADKVK